MENRKEQNHNGGDVPSPRIAWSTPTLIRLLARSDTGSGFAYQVDGISNTSTS